MIQRIHPEPEDDPVLPANFDWNQIFIGREQQLEFFRIYLERWQRQVTALAIQLNSAPSPNDKIPGLVVLLHGRGGFGKTTLLKRYREIALEYRQNLHISKPVDWEFAAKGHRTLFSLAPGEEVDASQYLALLCNQLANALGKRSEDFREYLSAVKDVEEATKLARGVLGGLQQDERYSWLRGIAAEGILALLRLIPRSQVLLNNEQIANKIRDVAGEGVQIGLEQVQQVWARLHDKLGSKLDNYLEQSLHLGLAMGRDLTGFAKKHPVLIFFDTYEEIDEGDELLRSVMGAAGSRVGWILSGRDNLWAGLIQRLRSQDTVYGYKDIVFPNLGLAVDFSADGVGDFTLSDIEEYFSQLCKKVSRQPPLRTVTEKDAAHILDVTRGVPLAVKIAASLYLEYPDLTFLTEGTDSKREIVDQMVRRYLLHTRTNPTDRARLYGLALLRRAEEPSAIAAALDLPASSNYGAELTRLHRRYGFVFTKQEQPSLHQEVRYFLRLWLLEHRAEPGIVEVNQRLKEAHLAVLKALEARRQYTSIRARLEDDQWMECYLDLVEQNFWLDPTQGTISILPFMLAAAIYRRNANREAFKVGMFFEPVMSQPYRKHWEAAADSLRYSTSRNPLPDELTGLKDLVKLTSDNGIAFESPLPDAREELEAALWYRLGEAYRGRQEDEALDWYNKALSQLSQETGMSEQEVKVLLDVDIEDGKHEEAPPAAKPKQIQTGVAISKETREKVWPTMSSGLVEKNTTQPGARISRRRMLISSLIAAGIVGGGVGIAVLEYPRFASSPTHPSPSPAAGTVIYTYLGHQDKIRALAWSLDSNRIATASDDYTAQAWDATTGEHAVIYHGHSSYVEGASWSPNGKLIVSGSADGTAQIWNPHTGQHLYTYNGHRDFYQRHPSAQGHPWVNQVAWSPNGKYIASCDQFGVPNHITSVQVWDAATGRTITTYTGHTDGVFTVAWSPDSRRVASGGYDGTLQVWDALKGKTIAVNNFADAYIFGLAWSPDGNKIAFGGTTPDVVVVDTNTWEISAVYYGHIDAITDIAWSPNGILIAASSGWQSHNYDNTVHVFNADTNERVLVFNKQSGNLAAVGWSPNGKFIASGSELATVDVWQAPQS